MSESRTRIGLVATVLVTGMMCWGATGVRGVTVEFTAATQSGAEDVGTMTVTAEMSGTSGLDVTVPYTLSGTAADPDDYTITASPVTISAGSLTADITITVVDDLLDELDETVIVTMGTPTNATKGATDVHTATITDNDAPLTVTTAAISNITGTTADSGGNVTADGGYAVTARGVCWSTSENPTIAGSYTEDGTGTGAFISNITGLSSNTTYHVRAYATNSVGTSYGSDVSFTTDTTPTVTTTAISNITGTTADSGGTVTDNGGEAVTAHGVSWSMSANPTTADSKTTDGTGTGAFTSDITGLTPSTTYYVRAYATNSVGTSYGNEVSFTTSAGGDPVDYCPYDPYKTSPGVCGCGVADIDTDGDGTLDCNDGCPDDADKIDAGVCGCGVTDTDTDGDGTPDCNDGCPGNPDKIEPGVYGCYGEATADEEEIAEVSNDAVDAAVEGFEEDTYVAVLTDDAGTTTLTATDLDGESVLTVSADGLGDGARIDVSMDELGNPSVTMTDAGGATLTVNAMHYPAGIEIYGARDDQDQVVVGVTDDLGAARTVIVEAIGADRDIVLNVIYNMPEQEPGQAVPGLDGTVTAGGEQMADADSVTIEAVGLLGSAVITVALEYWEADYAGGDESELRLLRLDDETGQYLAAGTNDVGDEAPTQTLGDYGVDTAAKTVWAQVNELGTFAIAPVLWQELLLDEDDDDVIVTRGPVCGILGIVPFLGSLLLMGVWTLARHRR